MGAKSKETLSRQDAQIASDFRQAIAAAGLLDDAITLYRTGELYINGKQEITASNKERLELLHLMVGKVSPNAKAVAVDNNANEDRASDLLDKLEQYEKDKIKEEKKAGVQDLSASGRANDSSRGD